MLGSDLCMVFPDAVKLTHSDLDITDHDQVLQIIEKIKPQVVINAAAYTDVDGCEDNQDLAFDVNGKAPGYIAKACYCAGATIVHYSTDYVFDGSKEEYLESDSPNLINIYGKSKLLGEENIIENMDDYRIIRTSWLFGIHGNNFIETMLKLSAEMKVVKVVNDQFGKPTYTADIARKTKEVIRVAPGIYHIVNEGACSWYDFASSIIENVVPCSSKEFSRRAKRPKYSVLTNTKTVPMRNWKEALSEYLDIRNKGD